MKYGDYESLRFELSIQNPISCHLSGSTTQSYTRRANFPWVLQLCCRGKICLFLKIGIQSAIHATSEIGNKSARLKSHHEINNLIEAQASMGPPNHRGFSGSRDGPPCASLRHRFGIDREDARKVWGFERVAVEISLTREIR